MVVLQKKRGEKVLQLHEEDLLNYFSVYGEITSKAVASKYHTIEGRPVLVFPATKRADSQPSRVAPQTAVVTDQRASASDEIASETALKIDGKGSKGASVKTYLKAMASPNWTESASMKAVPESAATLDQGTSGAAPLMTATEPGVIPRETTYSSMNIAQQTTQEQEASVQEEALSATPQHVEVARGAKNAQKASMHIASMYRESGKVRFTGKASPVSSEDQKQKILVTQSKGCKGYWPGTHSSVISKRAFAKHCSRKKIDLVIVPGASTKLIQAPDVCWSKPFKAACFEKYDEWLGNVEIHDETAAENLKAPP
ncbi:hypothetical protein AWC38_SpisGene14185 [Stylophora pistillata]|uniref:Uncharacterized protein n=1 Tax=Stylophora pistillata TaxID=50429 RepID=A0A2B4RUR9_STYPI|nr:hypothetical protein AWC38_SpisGene14185 [Stylophora pistillata]